MCLFPDTTKPFGPKPASAEYVSVPTTRSNGAEATDKTDVSSAHGTVSDTRALMSAPQGATNITGETKRETRPEDTGKKDEPGTLVSSSRDGACKEKSTDDSLTGKGQPQLCDSSSGAKLGRDVEAREGDVDAEEESFAVGDKVAIKVSENVLVELQEDYGGCTEGMAQVTT